MGTNASLTTVQYVLKSKYSEKQVASMLYKNSYLFGVMKKDPNFGGNDENISVRIGGNQGGSSVLATAQANKSGNIYRRFTLTRKTEYHVAGITGEAMAAGEEDANGLVNTVKEEMDATIQAMKRSFDVQIFRNGGGARGRISSTSNVATNTITLAEPTDIVHFEVGMVVQNDTTDGTSGTVNAGVETIAGCDRDLGTMTSTSATWDTVMTTVAAGNYLFREGDFGVAAKGVAAWIPSSAPSATAFFGVDRTIDTTRLAGVRYAPASGTPLEDILLGAISRLGMENGDPDMGVLNNLDWKNCVQNLSGKAIYEIQKSSDGKIGFKTLSIEGDKGTVQVGKDVNCPKGRGYILQHNTWRLKHLKALPHYIEDDGRKFLRDVGASVTDSIQAQLRAFWQVANVFPGYNATFPTA